MSGIEAEQQLGAHCNGHDSSDKRQVTVLEKTSCSQACILSCQFDTVLPYLI